MKPRQPLLRFLLLCIGALLMALSASAQQNLFNIPSGDITEKKKFFYQHQLNVYRDKLESKAHLVYGLGKGWDAGVNLVGKGFYYTPKWRGIYNSDPTRGAVYPILMATGQKQFVLDKHLNFNVGVQAGYNLSDRLENKVLNHFFYGITTYHFGKGSRVVLGGYHGNRMFLGEGNNAGILAGYELKLSKRWYLMGDWVSGRNDGAVAVIGGMFNAGKRVQLCAGWLLPNPNTPKPQGIVLEINLLGWDAF